LYGTPFPAGLISAVKFSVFVPKQKPAPSALKVSPNPSFSTLFPRMPSKLPAVLLATFLPLTLTAAVETWITPSGTPMQAECLGIKGDYVVFKKTDGNRVLLPFAKLTPGDQAKASGIAFKAPTNTFAVAQAKVPSASESSKIATALRGKLVGLNGRAVREVGADQLAGTQVYAVYFSASWCGPCRRFTPELVAAYPKIKAAHPEFEVIFVSSDEDEDSMKHYMVDDHMPWVGLRFSEIRTNATLARYQQPGIPNLVFIDGDGRIISKSYNDRGEYDGPYKVLDDIRRYFKM
jgi:nucleoredoxin